VALSEVQGYAHEAAVSGAALLDAFGRPGGDRWRAWAARLADRFRAVFWTGDEDGPFPAMALDHGGAAVDAAASNMGHLLGTGLLDEQESELVARRLTAPDLADAYGLRTMSSRAAGYSALSYHCGSVWPHDTAIVISGLARSGHGHRAGELIEGLLAASEAFDGRLPELWGGDARDQLPAPVPYPAACRPQAWSAAAAVCLLTAILGLDPAASGGRPTLRPMSPSPVGRLSVRGLRLAGVAFDVEIAADGTAVREGGRGLRGAGR
jgi:glycogen debranching enzyme